MDDIVIKYLEDFNDSYFAANGRAVFLAVKALRLLACDGRDAARLSFPCTFRTLEQVGALRDSAASLAAFEFASALIGKG